MILFSRLIRTCGFLPYAERSRSVRCGYLEMSSYRTLRLRSAYERLSIQMFYWRGNKESSYSTLRLRSAYERLPIQIFLIYFNREEIFYFKMMKGYKIGGRDFILKVLQQSPELQVTPEQKIFSSWQKWHRKFRQRQHILRKIKQYSSAISDLR